MLCTIGYLDQNRSSPAPPYLRPTRLLEDTERSFAFLSVPWTCLNTDFHGIDRGEECHGGCDRRLVRAERCIGCYEYLWHRVFLCVGW
jgi:hypothetical protein